MNAYADLADVQDRLANWWEHGDQETPLILTSVRDTRVSLPDTGDLATYWYDVDWRIDRQMRAIDSTSYYGVALPNDFPNLGSSCMAGVLGARMEALDKRTMWPHPKYGRVEDLMQVDLDPANPAYRTILELTRRSVALSRDHHYVAPYPLEGVSDLLAALYGNENYMVDLIAKPAEVKRTTEHIKRLWLRAFAEIEAVIAQGGNAGGIGWAGIWAPGTTFPLQEDITYMMSSAMYREFILPHVRDMVDAMDYAMYHLDGAAAIPHLDALLEIPRLRAVQWVPGPDQEAIGRWYPLIGRILDAGRSVEVFCRPDEIDDLVCHAGARGLLIGVSVDSQAEAEELMDRYWR